jgi:uncharacterized protein
MVGAVRFELTTSWTRTKRASQATLRPEPGDNLPVNGGNCNAHFKPIFTTLNFEVDRGRGSVLRMFAGTILNALGLLTGTILNALGILTGGLLGLTLGRQFSQSTQLAVRGFMGVFTVYIGLRMTWLSLNGSLYQIFKQVVVMVLSLYLGRFLGQVFRIQKTLNRLGHQASERIAQAKRNDPNRINDGFVICTLLFCAGPLGPLGAIQNGLMDYWQPLAIKMVMDGLAAMGFVCVFGWGVVLAAIPVFVYQGTVTLAAARLAPFLAAHHLLDSVNAVGGLLVFCVALVVLELKRLQLADYLPSLAVAPLIAWIWS